MDIVKNVNYKDTLKLSLVGGFHKGSHETMAALLFFSKTAFLFQLNHF